MKYGELTRGQEEVILNKLVAAANGDQRVFSKIVRGVIKITLTAVSHLVAKYAHLVKYNRTLKQLLRSYDWANSSITEKNFPSTEAGNKDVEFGLFDFSRDVFSDDAIAGMKAESFRPATAKETLSFGEKNPKLQLEHPIAGLGSTSTIDGEPRVIVLDREGSRRHVYLFNYLRIWRLGIRFLGVRIDQKAP